MITALREKVTVQKGGRIDLRVKTLKPGTKAEVIVLVEPSEEQTRKLTTADDLLNSGLVGLWANRADLGDSLDFARDLRKKAETRE